MTFFEYFTALAPKGETALIVKQKATGGYHADGSPKYTWPAFLPTHKRKPGESWFLNTGSFIFDRFNDGKPSASAANCTHVLFMMLDDIGTKSKEPPLAPTAIVETSPGNYQWWYAYSEQPTVGEHCAALTAIAAAGYTDPGATNAVRNCRLPGSVNVKPGRDAFVCREVEFHPEREFTLAEICAALGVTPAEADTARPITFRVKDTGNDSVLAWLNDHGLVLSNVNSEGWCSVVCPNHAEHTDGQISARYRPMDRSFCCYHSHCDHLTSQMFCEWVTAQGGPETLPGLRDDLVAEYTNKIGKLTPTEDFPDEASMRIAEVERSQAGREDRAGWHERFAYIVDDDAFFDRETCSEYSRRAFNAVFRGIDCMSSLSGRRVEASVWFDEHREARGGYTLKGLTYAAGEDWMVHKNGLVYGNLWRDARPKVTASGDPTPWLEHCRRLIEDPEELEHIWNVMAFKLQNPSVKINHAVLHGGRQGCGKDTMWAPFFWSVCGPHEKNKGLIDSDSLLSQWGYQLEAEIVVLNELKEPDARDRRALANRLKPIIAAPPEMLAINRKGLHPYQMLNRIFLLAFTNEDMPITLDSDDRRWFCVWSEAPKMHPDKAKELWGWYRNGGFEAVASWLYARDVSAFNAGRVPPMTEYKQKLIYVGMSNAEAFFYHAIVNDVPPFDKGVVWGPWHDVIQKLEPRAPTGVRLNKAALFHALKETGWIDKGLCMASGFNNKRHVFVKDDCSKADARRKVAELENEPAEPENVVPIKR